MAGIEILARWLDPGEIHGSGVSALAISPDGCLAASGSSDMTVRLWDLATGQIVKVLTGAEPYPLCLRFSPDCRQLAAGLDSGYEATLLVWSLESFEVLWARGAHYRTSSIAFSPDGAQFKYPPTSTQPGCRETAMCADPAATLCLSMNRRVRPRNAAWATNCRVTPS